MKTLQRFTASGHRADACALVALLVIWVGMILVVNPLGDFPLNDDWSYARAVRSLVQEGRFVLTDWTSMPLVVQVLWGGAFANWLGFSFNALRFSTLVLAAVGLIAAYGLFRKAQPSPALALFAVLSIAFNPLYFQLANSFMTDVPFVALALLSLLVWAFALERNSASIWLFGIAIAFGALFIRQIGLCLPIAAGVVLILKHGVRPRVVAAAILPPIIAFALLLTYRGWLVANRNLPVAYDVKTLTLINSLTQHPDAIGGTLAGNIFTAMMYVGFFLAPVSLLLAPAVWLTLTRVPRMVTTVFTVGMVSLVMVALQVLQRRMPLTGNQFFDGGLGPLTLRDVYVLGMPHYPSAPEQFWQGITFASVCSAVLLFQMVAIAIVRSGRSAGRNLVVLALGAGVLYFVPLSLDYFFDRYALPLQPLLLVALIGVFWKQKANIPRLAWAFALLGLLIYGCITVGATHDYMEWNRVRWQTLQALVVDKHVPPSEIDGGFEFNMFYLFPQYPHRPWSLYHDQYLVAFGPVADFEVVRQTSVATWLPFGKVQIVLLTKPVAMQQAAAK